MVAILSYAMVGAASARRGISVAGQRLGRGLRALGRSIHNRRVAAGLAGLDDHMLADIGLTRSDLRDAYSEPLWRDPTDILASRAAERRGGRREAQHDVPKLPWLSCETAACR